MHGLHEDDGIDRHGRRDEAPVTSRRSVDSDATGSSAVGDRRRPVAPAGSSRSTRSGQGYWTRMGTVGGAALIAILTREFLYDQSPVWFTTPTASAAMRSSLVVVGIPGDLRAAASFA